MSLEGKFESTGSENMVPFLKALGGDGSEEDIKKFVDTKISLEFKSDGNNKYTYVSSSSAGTRSVSFENGKEFTEDMLGKFQVKSVATVSGNKVVIKSTVPSGVQITRTYNVLADQTVVELVGPNNITAKRFYKRV